MSYDEKENPCDDKCKNVNEHLPEWIIKIRDIYLEKEIYRYYHEKQTNASS